MDTLMELVEREQIHLSYFDLCESPFSLYGLFFFNKKYQKPHIILERSLIHNERMHRSVLAEELGHHFTVPTGDFIVPYTSYSNRLALSRDEAKALKWACDYLMPHRALVNALREGIRTVDELSDHFRVTPWLVMRRIEIFKSRSWGNRTILTICNL